MGEINAGNRTGWKGEISDLRLFLHHFVKDNDSMGFELPKGFAVGLGGFAAFDGIQSGEDFVFGFSKCAGARGAPIGNFYQMPADGGEKDGWF